MLSSRYPTPYRSIEASRRGPQVCLLTFVCRAVKKYPSAIAAYGIIAKQEGIAALWTGWTPNVMRNSIINAAELASYDQVKQILLKSGFEVKTSLC